MMSRRHRGGLGADGPGGITTMYDPVPYLSIVVTGRNDNLGGDFNTRFFRALRFNHWALMAAGVNYEVVFVEWRPVPNRPLLAEILRNDVPELAGRLKTYVVDARYHEALSHNPALRFQEFIAKNVGIRRSTGAYILTTNTDIYLSAEIVALLGGDLLEPNVLYRATRVDLCSHLDPTRVDWPMLRDSRNAAHVNTLKPPLFTNAAGDFLLLDRLGYHQLRGFTEVYRATRVEVDNNFCYNAQSAGILLRDTGAVVYHLGEGTYNAGRSAFRAMPHAAPWGRAGWHWDATLRNPPAWGLRDAPVKQTGPADYFLDFSWDAVPPLVELRRVGAQRSDDSRREQEKEPGCGIY